MPLDEHDLIFCVNMAPRASLFERAAAAREAGYAAVSALPEELARLHGGGFSDADVRQRMVDEGMAIGELDGLATWLPGQQAPATFPEPLRKQLHANTPEAMVPIAAAMGARSITAIEFYGTPVDNDRAAEAFAGVCDRAAEEGILVHLEFLPWGGIPDLQSGWDIVEKAGRDNGGLLLDSWHFFRGGSTFAELLEIPGDRILGVQLNDAPAQAETDLAEETQHRRRLPGEGDFDLRGLIRTLDAIGSRAPLGVEVLSDDLIADPLPEIARRTFDATARMVHRARG